MGFTVYILYSKTLDRYYKGQTEDLAERIRRHNMGYEKGTKPGIPWDLVWSSEKSTRSEAMKLERKLKNMSRAKLERLIREHREK